MSDTSRIQEHVRSYYRLLYGASGPRPRASLPVLAGKELARSLGYPTQPLDSIPDSLWRQFHPCGNPLPLIRPAPQDRILNLGSGIGIDALCLLLCHDLPLQVVNLDVVDTVLLEGAKSIPGIHAFSQGTSPASSIQWICGDAEHLPFADGVFHWVSLNGVLNLFSRKEYLLREILRVTASGGYLVGADLCCSDPLPEYFADEPDAWAWCMSGACTLETLTHQLLRAGFYPADVQPAEIPDMFYRTTFSCRKPHDT